MKTKKELSDLKEEVETMNEKLHELTDEELAQVVGGNGGMSIGKVPPGIDIEELGEAVATPGGGVSQLIIEGCMGIDPRSESVTNPLSKLSNVDTLNRPPTPPSPVAEFVKKAVDAALQTW